jgi:hypothetical protein
VTLPLGNSFVGGSFLRRVPPIAEREVSAVGAHNAPAATEARSEDGMERKESRHCHTPLFEANTIHKHRPALTHHAEDGPNLAHLGAINHRNLCTR